MEQAEVLEEEILLRHARHNQHLTLIVSNTIP